MSILMQKILVAVSTGGALTLVASAYVWCGAKTEGVKRAAEAVRDICVVVAGLVLIAITADMVLS